MTHDYFHDFLFLNSERDGEPSTMLIGTADGSPGFWRRENRGARAAIYKSTDGAQSWTRITNGLAADLDSMVWALVHHPTDHNTVFAGFGNVARGHASGTGRRRRLDDQPRLRRQLGEIGYRVAGRSRPLGGGGIANAPRSRSKVPSVPEVPVVLGLGTVERKHP